MIKSKADYIAYLEADKGNFKRTLIDYIYPDPIFKFKRMLRKLEYYKNVKRGPVNKLIYFLLKVRFKRLSLKLGFSIQENVFGPGLQIPHYGTIVVHHAATIGANCKIHVCTNIGESGGVAGAPKIGNNVYIGPGAKIYGDIVIADNIAIAANAAVGKSFLTPGKIIGGVPAKEIGDIDITKIIKTIRKTSQINPEGIR
jgi:serine O-acetyltransferase